MMFKQRLILIVALAIIHVINGQPNPDVTVPDTTVTLIGEDAIITCTYTIFDGRTLAGVSWYNSTSAGAQLNLLVSSAFGSNPNGRYGVDTSQAGVATLTISNTLLSDDGFYQCIVADSGTLSTSHFGSLTVQYLDDVIIDISSNTTANVTITGSANGSPLPMINLSKDGVVIKTENGSTLTHKIVGVTGSDGGSYKCTATNSVGSKQSETIVLNYFKPGVTLDPDDATFGPGSIVTITAIVTANPDDITYKWTIDDPEIVVTDTSYSAFTFKVPESAEDGTEYIVTVNVTNSIGSTTQSAKITVKNCECKNGGTCEDDGCKCPPDYSGPTCDHPDDNSDNNIIVIIFGSFGGFGFVIIISGSGYKVYIIKKAKPPKDPSSDCVVPQNDVEMIQPQEDSDLKRYAASGGDLYTEVNLDKKKKPNSDNSSKPAPVDMNVEGLQYADLDLTRNLPTGKKDVINHPDQETTYSSIQTQRI